MSEVFQLCRERVSAEEAARLYGVVPDRHGKALCPFHPDHHPSMSFHRGRFRCWSCGAAGNAVDFTARLFGLAPLDAVRKLNGDFALGLPLDRPPGRELRREERKLRERREAERLFRAWREETLEKLCAAIRVGNLALRRDPETWSPEETEAVRQLARLEYRADTLEGGSLEEQMELFRRRREGEKLWKMSLTNT